ncbi:unnamed protein product [Urochloa decumbens]|uniref:F-box domain-containing protein n=1 Tax=Urochloa decumbens TaxID=240449 RepID=A0ABC8W9Z6_9POAL
MGGITSTAVVAQPELPFDLLEEIFLRLEDAADLIRVSAACASFHRLIFDGRFLRRFRSLHRPPVLGFLFDCNRSDRGFSFYPIELLRRSVPAAAHALARAADFSISSFPKPIRGYWHVRDVRDGRILLSRHSASRKWSFFKYLMVYDPLHRRQVQIPPISHDLVDAVGRDDDSHRQHFDPFLIPADVDEDNLSFQVMCNVISRDKVKATLLYCSVTREWHGVASRSTGSYGMDHCYGKRYFARGCFFWVDETVMLMLDMREMRFSMVDLPPGCEDGYKAVVEAIDGRVGLLILGDNTLDLYSKTLRDIGDRAKDWRHDHRIHLADDYLWFFAGGVVEGYTLLEGLRRDEYQVWESCSPDKEPVPNAHYFTVEIKKLVVKQLCVLKLKQQPNFLYASFPPPFAPPRI